MFTPSYIMDRYIANQAIIIGSSSTEDTNPVASHYINECKLKRKLSKLIATDLTRSQRVFLLDSNKIHQLTPNKVSKALRIADMDALEALNFLIN